jgi:hypothetical protein
MQWVWRVWRIGSWDLRESAGAEACGWKRRGHEQHRPHCVWGSSHCGRLCVWYGAKTLNPEDKFFLMKLANMFAAESLLKG